MAQIDAFDAALLSVMKAGKAAGRGPRPDPGLAVARAFDIPTMIKFAVGPSWSTIPASQQQSLTEAFQRLTIASYAHNFDGFSGERFATDPNVVTRGPDKVVQSRIVPTSGAPVTISYRMRESGGTWKIYRRVLQRPRSGHADHPPRRLLGHAGAGRRAGSRSPT